MSHPLARAARRLGTTAGLAAMVLLPVLPAPPAAQTCFNAYFEIQPPPTAWCERGWQIPSSGAWTEIWPRFGVQHPQFAFADYDLDGLIGHAESFIESPAGAPWYVAGVGTLYHLTPVEFLEGGGLSPIGPPVLAWSDQFWCRTEIRSDGRAWFLCPDTLVFLHPDCCERKAVADYLAGGVVGNGPPTLFAFAGPAAGELAWFFRDSLTCGLWVAPDDLVIKQFEAMPDEDLDKVTQRGERPYTARRGLRRALEHPWEHLREIQRRLEAPANA